MIGGVAFAPGCAPGTQSVATHSIDSVRVVDDAHVDFDKHATHAERFGLSTSRTKTATPSASSSDDGAGFTWTTPKGWTELPPSTMRVANFRVDGDSGAECYMTMLAGDAGGLAANVNRWRTQLSLPAMPARDIEALPKSELLGQQAVLVDAVGSWKGMSGGDARPNWRLLGLLLVGPNGSVFLKMTGPDAIVAAQRDAFCALARSFHSKSDPAPAQGTDAIEENKAAEDHAAGFAFTIPTGWRRAPDRPSRAFSLFAGSSEELQCYVTVLEGDAGGTLSNVNRWRGQLGLTSIQLADVSVMPTLTLLGSEARLVECDGVGASLIGVACNGEKRSVFVKMTGPKDLVNVQRAAFLEFCSSLKDAQ